ncbi:hypothetical protein N0S44_000275 [Escherichia coli]|nr:hypothetical protein [Escherichia coli]EJR1979120.1 hypothetical protein [Escherichia coli]
MLVYRFELKFSYIEPYLKPATNVGPFARYSSKYSTKNGFDRLYMSTPTQFQPEPTDDGIYSIKYGWAFGCQSLNDLFRFFTMDLGKLHRAGFAISVYDVPDNHVDIGRNQVQYYCGSAILVRIMSVKDAKVEYRQSKRVIHEVLYG